MPLSTRSTKTARNLFSISLLTASAVYLYQTILFFRDADVSYPVFDNWYYFADLCRYIDSGNPMGFIFSQANEHRPVLLFTSMFIDYLYDGFNLTFMKAFHLISYTCLVAFILWLSGEIFADLDRPVRRQARIIVYTSGLFFLLSMRQWEVHYGYTNVGTIQGFLFFVCSIYLYNKRFEWKSSGKIIGYKSLAAVIFFALLSSFSMVFGLLAMPFVFVLSIIRRADKKEVFVLLITTLCICTLYASGMNFSPSSNSQWQFNLPEILRIAYFSILLPGALFLTQKKITFIIGLIGTLIVIILSTVIARKRLSNNAAMITIYCLVLLTMAYALMVGIGRRHMIDEQAMVPRYMLTAAIFWHGLFALSTYAGLRLFDTGKKLPLVLARIALVPIIVLLFIHQKLRHEQILEMVSKNSTAVTALQFDVIDPETFPAYQLINIEEFYESLKQLKHHATSIYGVTPATFFGKNATSLFVTDNSLCSGSITGTARLNTIKQVVDDPSATGLRLSGWLDSASPDTAPSGMLLVDQDGVIRGAGTMTATSPAKAGQHAPPTGPHSSWVAFARLDSTSTTISSYALYARTKSACLLDTITLATRGQNFIEPGERP